MGTGRKISGQMVAKTEPGDSAEESVGLHIPRKSPTHTPGGGEGGRGGEFRTCPKKISKSHLADKKEPGCLKNDRLTRSV